MLSETRHWRLHTPEGPLTSRDTRIHLTAEERGCKARRGLIPTHAQTHTAIHSYPHTCEPTRSYMHGHIHSTHSHTQPHTHTFPPHSLNHSHTQSHNSFPSISRVTFTHSHPLSYLSLTLMSQSSPSPCLQPLTVTHARARHCSWLTYGHMPQMPGHCGPHASPLCLSLRFSISVSLFLSLSTPELLSQPVEEAGLTLCP